MVCPYGIHNHAKRAFFLAWIEGQLTTIELVYCNLARVRAVGELESTAGHAEVSLKIPGGSVGT